MIEHIPDEAQDLILEFCKANKTSVDKIMPIVRQPWSSFIRRKAWQFLYSHGYSVVQCAAYWQVHHSTVSKALVAGRDAFVWSIKYERCVRCKDTKKKHRARGLCTTCYERERSGVNDDAVKVKVQSEVPDYSRKSPFPSGALVKEKDGLWGDASGLWGNPIHGRVQRIRQDCETGRVIVIDGEDYLPIKMLNTGVVMPLRVSTLERVYTPVEEWDDPATDIEDDVAAIFAEVGA